MTVDVYNLDLDEELISHLASENSLLAIRSENLSVELIQDELATNIFKWQIEHIREHGSPATPSVLADEFELELVEPLTAIGDLIDRLRVRYMRNNARGTMEKVGEVYQADPVSVPHIMINEGRRLSSLIDKKGENYGSGDFQRAITRYDEAVLKGQGPSLGFKELDDHFFGMRGVTFLLAPPKTWKSWVNLNSLIENIKCGRSCWVYSLELPAEETDMRVRCLAANVPFWRYLRGALTLSDRKNLAEASELLDSLGIYRCVKPPPGGRTVEEMVERARDNGADVIYIDQLQYIETQSGKQLGGSDPREFWQPLNMLRDLSDDGPLFIVHQFNRSSMNADSMPEMQQAKGSSAVEEIATLILGLWANKDMRRSNVMEVGTLASRNYMLASWEVGIELSRGCNFELLGKVEDKEND
jgi:hypothetical protein